MVLEFRAFGWKSVPVPIDDQCSVFLNTECIDSTQGKFKGVYLDGSKRNSELQSLGFV